MIKAVIFDLFETLITLSREPNARLSAAELLGIDEETYRSEWRARQKARYTGEFEDYPAAVRDLCRALNLPVDEEVIERLNQDRLQVHAKPFARIDSEILDMLRSLRSMGIKIGLITNTSPDEVALWESSALAPLIDHVVFSYKTGHMKPEPEIYFIASTALGVEPQECIFVGDGGSNELPGAAEAGMTPYCATWFIDRWPEEVRERHMSRWNTNFKKLRKPEEVVTLVRQLHSSSNTSSSQSNSIAFE